MGNRTSRRQDHAMSLFDIAALIVHDRMPITPTTVPTCLDELVDWTEEATLLVNHLTLAGVNVILSAENSCRRLCFIPLVLTGDTEADVLVQKDVTRFPKDCTFERTAFYHQDILICVQALDPLQSSKIAPTGQGVSTLSGLNFCIYLKLLRRLAHLVDLDDSLSVQTPPETTSDDSHDEIPHDEECGICMARPQDTVLPCLHGVCSSCEARWVETHMDCPFCRKQYRNQRRRKRDQWQMEKWSRNDVEKDMANLELQVQSFWKQHGSALVSMKELEKFTRLQRSFTESVVDDDFVLLY